MGHFSSVTPGTSVPGSPDVPNSSSQPAAIFSPNRGIFAPYFQKPDHITVIQS
jgi:hypothetical protein